MTVVKGLTGVTREARVSKEEEGGEEAGGGEGGEISFSVRSSLVKEEFHKIQKT